MAGSRVSVSPKPFEVFSPLLNTKAIAAPMSSDTAVQMSIVLTVSEPVENVNKLDISEVK